MKRFKLVLALLILVGLMVPEVASADRGRGGHDFQQRHDVFRDRHGGFRPRGDFFARRDHRFIGREVFRNRSDHFRPRGDFIRDRGSIARHRLDGFRHDFRPLPVRRRHHSHSHFGLNIGVPLYWNWPPPYYAYPPAVVTVPAPPTVYIERDYDEAAPEPGYWYYCDGPEGYYPYVKECPGGWQRVSPTPAR